MLMVEKIVHDHRPVTLVGGGKATPEDLYEALTLAPTCVAADGGAALAALAEVSLAAVIGDFDSIPGALLAELPEGKRHRIAEQSSTDFEKALSRIAAPLVIGVGFTGGRIDHQLAAFHSLMRFAAQPCALLAETEVIFLAPPVLRLPTEPGDVISLFPLAPVTGRSDGLVWPIAGLEFAPGAQIGTSNRATGPLTLEIDAAAMLVIVSRSLLGAVVAELSGASDPRWSGGGAV
ncbi:thiamine diphosphokinase [Sulfitobacter aestuarii]|uniref:Thiamine diphosphokinase n=1 Tax=Sulfitobacter aestuarii TaxID=2161676 RepID=A0ABW5U081_9RHOB